MHNRVELLGRVGGVSTAHTKKNIKIVYLTVATHDSHKNSRGQISERTTWVQVQCYDRLADIIEENAHIGDLIYIDGKLDMYTKEDKNGIESEVICVKCKSARFLGRGAEGNPLKHNGGNR